MNQHLRFSDIDDRLSIYNEKKVIIWGASIAGKEIYHLLCYHNIEVLFFCDNDSSKWGKFLGEIAIISPTELKELCTSDNSKILVQIASELHEYEIAKQLTGYKIDNIVWYTEAKYRLKHKDTYGFFQNNKAYYETWLEKVYQPDCAHVRSATEHFEIMDTILSTHESNRDLVLLCMPPKTGDNTMLQTFQTQSVPFDILNLWHSGVHFKEIFDLVKGKRKIKIISATREPIGQNISMIFQGADQYLWDQPFYWENGGDPAAALNFHFQYENGVSKPRCIYHRMIEIRQIHSMIQYFFEDVFMRQMGINLYEYPFDKEKGCSVISCNDVEIFIYQLEKLNEIRSDLLSFLNADPDIQLINGNEAKNKYYAANYKNAIKSIPFTEEYYNWSFHVPYLKHFYTANDIEAFQKKWISHIISPFKEK